MQFPTDWQRVNEDTDRLFVKGGWLVRVYVMEKTVIPGPDFHPATPWKNSTVESCRSQDFRLIFVDDATHEWGVKS